MKSPMTALQQIGMGLVIIALTTSFGGYDALPDPVGWLLVWLGVSRLDASPHRRNLRLVVLLAGAVSVVVWFPAVRGEIDLLDASIGWGLSLPQIVFPVLLCRALGQLAVDDARANTWLRTLTVVFVIVGVLPLIVLGGGVDALTQAAAGAATLSLIVLIVLLFSWNKRPWATATESGAATATE